MKNKLIQVMIFVIFLSLVVTPSLIKEEIIEALQVFFTTLFPAIFPFFLISDLLIRYNFCNTLNKYFSKINNFLFHTSNASNFVIIMSIFSGFPSGAKYIKTLLDKNMLSLNQANYLITFTHFANPLFVLAISSSILKKTTFGYLILLCHILANIIIAIMIRPKEKEKKQKLPQEDIASFSTNLSNSIASSLQLLISILGNTCFFFIVSKLITTFLNLEKIPFILVNGFFDMTKGLNSISSIYAPTLLKAILMLTFLSFGGVNVHMQVLDILKKTKVSYPYFLLGRISQAAISSILFFIIYQLFF